MFQSCKSDAFHVNFVVLSEMKLNVSSLLAFIISNIFKNDGSYNQIISNTTIYLKPEIFNNQNRVNFVATIEIKFLFLQIHIKHKDVTSKLRFSNKTKQVSNDSPFKFCS